ncbi:unnamed protein product [Rhodiola kirilowii]
MCSVVLNLKYEQAHKAQISISPTYKGSIASSTFFSSAIDHEIFSGLQFVEDWEKRVMDNRQGGIQQLLTAEQEAQQIVNSARTEKMARLRQAKEEAQREIAAYRSQIELEFQKKVSQSSGDSGANVKRLEQETDTKINHLKTEAASISSDVVSMLLKQVTTVQTLAK